MALYIHRPLSFLNYKIGFLNICFKKYSICSLLRNPELGSEIEIKGWIANIRKQKHNIFIDVKDGSTSEQVQVIVSSDLNVNTKELSAGSSIITSGSIVKSPKGNIEILAKKIKLISKCSTEEGYPFAPRKEYSPEYIRQYLHLRTKTNHFASLLRVRNSAVLAFHSAFQDEGVINVHTPILTSNDCEGAGETFKVIPDNEHLLKSMAKSGVHVDEIFFNKKSYLTVSAQFHLEALANGLGSVYTFGPTFRAENSKSRFHLAEFYMIEVEIAFLEELKPLLNFVERLLKKVTNNLLDNNISDIVSCQGINRTEFEWLEKDFVILSFDEALNILNCNASQFKKLANAQNGFNKEHEIFLVKYLGNIPTFIIDWPRHLKPFYMKECKNDSKVLAFDLLAPDVGEIVGGGLREDDFQKLEEKLPKEGVLEWYLDFRKFGGISTGGFGLGFERYLQTILKIDNIKDTIPFPRWPHNCSL
ncbi:hypothetical protein WA026_019228 [Henosepilachna vigintioctopunctata]|uniref:asparagine--tRNA ligase n=1 Tax=Henosepilachna vigintioctopunctata TaxID=420089 RepID=A0AAW1V457_9CUCU